MKPTALHTHRDTIRDYARVAHDLLDSLTADVENMQESNADEAAAWPDADAMGNQLAYRMDLVSWLDHTTQQLRDVMYLLAVGDNGAQAVHEADPERASRQAHHDRRRRALDRCEQAGLTFAARHVEDDGTTTVS